MHHGDEQLRAAVKEVGISEEWLWEKPPPGTFKPWGYQAQQRRTSPKRQGGGSA